MVAEHGSSSQSFGAKYIPQGFLLWLPGLADSTEHSIICVGGMLSILLTADVARHSHQTKPEHYI
jgi:hypothetical protein